MEKRRIRIAIVHSGKDSYGYQLAERTLSDQSLTELFEPVMMEKTGEDGIEHMVNSYREGAFDAVTDMTDRETDYRKQDQQDALWAKATEEDGKQFGILLTENLRMALWKSGSAPTAEQIVLMATELHKSLTRDFRISSPRIAILYPTTKNDKQDDEVVAPAIKQLTEHSIQAYGPYNAGDFFEQGRHLEFDAVIATDAEQGIMHFNAIATDDDVRYTAGLTLVRTMPFIQHREKEDEYLEETDMNKVRQAIYRASDIVRHRKEYDTPLRNPLKKLYKDRKDESEKIRFNIPKKKDSVQG